MTPWLILAAAWVVLAVTFAVLVARALRLREERDPR